MSKDEYKYYRLSQYAQFTLSRNKPACVYINDSGLPFSVNPFIRRFDDLGDMFLERTAQLYSSFNEQSCYFINRFFDSEINNWYKTIKENGTCIAYNYSPSVEDAISYNGHRVDAGSITDIINGLIKDKLINYHESLSRLDGNLVIGLDGKMYIAFWEPYVRWLK